MVTTVLTLSAMEKCLRKKLTALKKLENIGLDVCQSCNLISYRDREIVEWNRSGILLVTSIMITMVMVTIAILDGLPTPMGCAPKSCCQMDIFPQSKPMAKHIDRNQHEQDRTEKIVTASRWMTSKLYLLRDR